MYIPTAPLPTLETVFKSFTPLRVDSLGHPWRSGGHDHINIFPRGAYALAKIARAVAKNLEKPICFLPSYFCNQSLYPLRRVGSKIVFYRMGANFCPDWDDVYHHAKKRRPDLFVLVHYFGLINDVSTALTFTEETGCTLLEDAAHLLTPYSCMAQTASIQLFSPHKLLALPPIALLSYSESTLSRSLEQHQTGWRREDVIWGIKRLIQMLIVALSWNAVWETREYWLSDKQQIIEKNFISKDNFSAVRISRLSLFRLQVFQNELDRINSKRLSNYAYLAAMIKELSKNKDILPWATWPKNQVPYIFPLRISEKYIPSILRALHEKSIPIHTWPDLPPEIMKNPHMYQKTLKLKNSFLFLPIHQGLVKNQLDYMGENLILALKRSI